jgi:hypothetical protein
MTENDVKNWQDDTREEIDKISNILRNLKFSLDEVQPHISGERFLMTKNKLVLVGKRNSDNLRVIIKSSNNSDGQREITNEKNSRDTLQTLSFTQETILFPKEIFFGKKDDYLFWISEFIEQEKVFVEHSLEEQFFLILKAFESQESFHATTFEHFKSVSSVFPVFYAREYFKEFEKFKESFTKNYPDPEIQKTLELALQILKKHKKEIDTFCGYLTHTDFVPHNFRVKNRDIYMLDCSAVRFGNKYESWARFLNYMIIHNSPLEKILVQYIKENRDDADCTNLHLMRIYKIGFLLQYYSFSINKTSGNLKKLTGERIGFWHQILKLIIGNNQIDSKLIENYKKKRDNLRSTEEKKRQKEFAIA